MILFTGLIQALGKVTSVQEIDGDKHFIFSSKALDFDRVELGDSIAVNGVCLTVKQLDEDSFGADVSVETLNCTTLGSLNEGSAVNFEKSLTPDAMLGGHLVSGHVDGVGKVLSIDKEARSWRFSIAAPEEFARYIAQKGSICVDGTSLTVNSVNNEVFELNIIPHTFENTLFSEYKVGTEVNLEVDIIARYLERLSQLK